MITAMNGFEMRNPQSAISNESNVNRPLHGKNHWTFNFLSYCLTVKMTPVFTRSVHEKYLRAKHTLMFCPFLTLAQFLKGNPSVFPRVCTSIGPSAVAPTGSFVDYMSSEPFDCGDDPKVFRACVSTTRVRHLSVCAHTLQRVKSS